jgi:hypothetical protein
MMSGVSPLPGPQYMAAKSFYDTVVLIGWITKFMPVAVWHAPPRRSFRASILSTQHWLRAADNIMQRGKL